MELSLNTVAMITGAIVMFWALFTRDGQDEGGAEASLIGIIIMIPVVAAVILALIFVVPVLLGIAGIALAIAAIGAILYGLWRLVTWEKFRSMFGSLMRGIGKTLRFLRDMLVSAVKKLRPVLKKFMKGLRELLRKTVALLRKALKAALKTVKAIGRRVLALLRSTMRGAAKLLTKLIRPLLPTLRKIATVVQRIALRMFKILKSVLGRIVRTLGKAFKAAAKLLRPLLRAFGKLLKPILKALGKMLKPLLRALGKVLKAAFKFLKPLFRAVAKVLKALVRTMGRIFRAASKMVQALLKRFPLLRKSIQATARLARKALRAFARVFRTLLKPFMPAIRRAVRLLARALRGFARLALRIPALARFALKLRHLLIPLFMLLARRKSGKRTTEEERREPAHAKERAQQKVPAVQAHSEPAEPKERWKPEIADLALAAEMLIPFRSPEGIDAEEEPEESQREVSPTTTTATGDAAVHVPIRGESHPAKSGTPAEKGMLAAAMRSARKAEEARDAAPKETKRSGGSRLRLLPRIFSRRKRAERHANVVPASALQPGQREVSLPRTLPLTKILQENPSPGFSFSIVEVIDVVEETRSARRRMEQHV